MTDNIASSACLSVVGQKCEKHEILFLTDLTSSSYKLSSDVDIIS